MIVLHQRPILQSLPVFFLIKLATSVPHALILSTILRRTLQFVAQVTLSIHLIFMAEIQWVSMSLFYKMNSAFQLIAQLAQVPT